MVEVKPHHMKNNSFSHGFVDPKRHCPLQEALEEAGYKIKWVGAFSVRFEEEDIGYCIDRNVWCGDSVESYINAANKDSQESVLVTLTKTL